MMVCYANDELDGFDVAIMQNMLCVRWCDECPSTSCYAMPYLPINLHTIHLSFHHIYPFIYHIYPFIYHIYPFIYLNHLSISLSYLSINRSIYLSISLSIYLSIYLFIYSSISLFIYLSIHPLIYSSITSIHKVDYHLVVPTCRINLLSRRISIRSEMPSLPKKVWCAPSIYPPT